MQGWRSRVNEQQTELSDSVRGRFDEVVPAPRHDTNSGTLSITSQSSYASGTVFRTASGQTVTGVGTSDGHDGTGGLSNNAVRMRSIVQVDV